MSVESTLPIAKQAHNRQSSAFVLAPQLMTSEQNKCMQSDFHCRSYVVLVKTADAGVHGGCAAIMRANN